jgi:hypothetical protein
MIHRIVILLVATAFLFGCAGSSKKMNKVGLGMTKAEVIEAIGDPKSTSANEDIEYLRYKFMTDGLFTAEYYIRLQEGKVNAFGRVGDFGLGY